MSASGLELLTTAPEQTRAMARAFGALCRPGDVIGLTGTLGAGKTCFVKGLAAGLAVEDARRVTSPTFVLMRSYAARLTLHHFDAYRLTSAGEMDALGCAETFESGGVSVIEWADHVAECLPPEHFILSIQVEGERRRRFVLTGVGEGARSRRSDFAEVLGQWSVNPSC